MFKDYYQKGFTLVEVLTASLILVLVITGALTALESNLRTARLLKQQLIAVNLAQEGLEVTRNIRDRDWHLDNSFGDSLSQGGPYIVEWNSDSLTLISGVVPRLRKDSNGIFNYSDGNETEFTRTISITDVLEDGILSKKVIARVFWPVSGGTDSVSAELRLYDWR